MKLIKELTKKQRSSIIKHLSSDGFKITHDGEDRISFKKGLREFSLYSTNVDDSDYGLSTYPNLEDFLKRKFKIKSKHTTSLQDKLYEKNYSIDRACKILHWSIEDCLSLNDFMYLSDLDEPVAEIIYEVQIKNLSHLIVDDQVYEGDLKAIRLFIQQKSKDAFLLLSEHGKSILDEISKL